MRIIGAAGVAAMVLGSMLTVLPNARAAEGNGVIYEAMGRAHSTGPACPAITWAIHPVGTAGNGGLSGVLWYLDMSGVSLARGAIGPDGKFALTLTSVSGSGPTGNITGARGADGALMADLNGPGCSKLHISLKPMEMPMYSMPGSGG